MNTHDLDGKGAAAPSAAAPSELKNLAYEITEILRIANHPRPEAWMQGLHPDTFTVDDPGIQRFHINRYWRVELAKLSVDTMDLRFCLVDTGQISDWLRLFRTGGVAECIAKHNLPSTQS
jgi:hypothetical protein